MGLYIPFFYITQYCTSSRVHDVTTDMAFYSLITMNAASNLGRILPGYLADSYGQLNVITVCTIGVMITSFCWCPFTNYADITVFVAFHEFLSGSFVWLVTGVFAFLTPERALIGAWVCIGCLFPATGLLIGPSVGGVVLAFPLPSDFLVDSNFIDFINFIDNTNYIFSAFELGAITQHRTIPAALAFYRLVPSLLENFKTIAERTSQHVTLLSLSPCIIGSTVHAKFTNSCGDAADGRSCYARDVHSSTIFISNCQLSGFSTRRQCILT